MIYLRRCFADTKQDTKRPVCEDSLSIDVRRWSRDGLLRPYQKFSCTWCSGDQALASISVAIEADATFLVKAGSAVLTFQWRRRETAEWTEACQRVHRVDEVPSRWFSTVVRMH